MSDSKKIAKNTLFQFIGRIFSIVFGVLAISLMTRYLGTNGYGMYVKILTFFQIFTVMFDLGLSNVTLKMISHESDENTEKIVNKIFTLRIILNIVVFIIPFFSLLTGYEDIVKKGIFIASFAFFFSNLAQILMVLLQKKIDTKSFVIAEIIARALFFILIIFVSKLNFGLIGIVVSTIITNIIQFLIVLFGTKKYAKIKLDIDFKLWTEALKMSWPFAISIIFNLIYFRADTFFLTLMKSNHDVGIYSAAYKILEIYITMPALFMSLIIPILDREFKNNNLNRFNNIIQKAFDFFSMIILPMIVGGLFLSNDVVILLAGNEFLAAGKVLQVLIITMGIITLSSLYTNIIIAVNQQKKMMIGYGVVAVLSVILYFLVIPKFSYLGVAYTKIFIEGVILITAFILSYKKIKKLPSLKSIPKILLATLIMGFSLYILKIQLNFDIFITLPSAILIYFFALFAVRGIDREIIEQLIT